MQYCPYVWFIRALCKPQMRVRVVGQDVNGHTSSETMLDDNDWGVIGKGG